MRHSWKRSWKYSGALFKAPVAVLMFTLVGIFLAACDQADAARPPICRDAGVTAAVTDAANRLRAAEAQSRRIAMGGNAFDAAKVGPIPGADLDAAMQRAAAEITQARRDLVAVRQHCMAE
jgi:hypothetical protein